jgi:hypothetical protein
VDCDASFHGDNVFIYGPSLSTFISPQKFDGVTFDVLETEKFYGEWKDNESFETLVNWMSQNSIIYVNDGDAKDGCGIKNAPCWFFFCFYFVFYLKL